MEKHRLFEAPAGPSPVAGKRQADAGPSSEEEAPRRRRVLPPGDDNGFQGQPAAEKDAQAAAAPAPNSSAPPPAPAAVSEPAADDARGDPAPAPPPARLTSPSSSASVGAESQSQDSKTTKGRKEDEDDVPVIIGRTRPVGRAGLSSEQRARLTSLQSMANARTRYQTAKNRICRTVEFGDGTSYRLWLQAGKSLETPSPQETRLVAPFPCTRSVGSRLILIFSFSAKVRTTSTR